MGIYQGSKFGFVQSTVYDQMGISQEGRLANASDINLCDGVSVGETNGIGVGLGVTIAALSGAKKAGINDECLKLPISTSTAADFGGILIATDTCRTNEAGRNYMGAQEIGTVLRTARVGGRIWIKAQEALTKGGSIYWIVNNATAHGKEIGGFTGTSHSSDTVELTNLAVKSSAAAGELALVEVLGEVKNADLSAYLKSADAASTYLSSADAATTYQEKLVAGDFVAIDADTNEITTTYTAGTGITISNDGEISAG